MFIFIHTSCVFTSVACVVNSVANPLALTDRKFGGINKVASAS